MERKLTAYRLERWRENMADDIAHFADNPRIAEWLRDAFPSPYTARDAREYMQGCISAGERDRFCRAITVDGRAVGSIGVFLGGDVYFKSAELGYWLAEPFWGRGIMTRAVREVCREAFGLFPQLERIYAEPFAGNIGSRRVLERAGFTLEGVLRKSVCKRGVLQDSCMYALLRCERSEA